MMKPIICFIGLDGSGKSTSIKHAYQVLKNEGFDVEIVRAAYVVKVVSFLVKLGKKIMMKGDSNPYSGDYKEYLIKMRKEANKGFVYKVFSFLTTLEFKMQILFNIRLKSFMGKVLLIDRYIYDNAVTYAANLGAGKDYIEKTISGKWKHTPKPDLIIYIKTPVEVCCSRKDDIPDPYYLEIREPLYDELASLYDVKIISGNQKKNAMLKEVEQAIWHLFEKERTCHD